MIGGSDADLEHADNALEIDAQMHALLQAGRLVFWRRVSPEALPEFYSRSTAVVMPSEKELFGIVAIEAMACGTPVVAASVEGLRHIVLHRSTGFQFAPGDSQSLAWILMSMALNPRIRYFLSCRAARWARFGFKQSAIIKRMQQVYDAVVLPPHPLEDPEQFFRAEQERVLSRVAAKDAAKIIHDKHNLIYHCRKNEQKAIKVFADKPTSDFSNFVLDNRLVPFDRRVHKARTLFHKDNPHAVPLLAIGENSSSHPYLPRPAELEWPALVNLANGFSMWMGSPGKTLLRTYSNAWRQLWLRQDWTHLYTFDRASGLINEAINGRPDVFTRTDPRAELIRYRLHIEAPIWPMRDSLSLTMRRCIEQLLAKATPDYIPPKGCHGDFLPRHILVGPDAHVLCDFEETRFVVGPLDIAHLAICNELAASGTEICWGPIMEMIGADLKGTGSRSLASLAILWIAVQIIYVAIRHARRGDAAVLDALPSRLQALLRASRQVIK